MNYFTFLSQSDPTEYGYKVLRETEFDYRFNGVCRWGLIYQTYGDGMVQHSREVPFQRERIPDFLGSLAVAIAEEEDMVRREDMIRVVAKHWPRVNQDKAKIRFALSLKFNPNKTTYYSLDERKVSSSHSKADLRSWTPMKPWDTHIDGSISSAAGIMNVGAEYDTLHIIQRYQEIEEVFREDNDGRSDFKLWEHLKITEHTRYRGWAHSAWAAVHNFVEAFRLHEDALHRAGQWKEHGVMREKEAVSA